MSGVLTGSQLPWTWEGSRPMARRPERTAAARGGERRHPSPFRRPAPLDDDGYGSGLGSRKSACDGKMVFPSVYQADAVVGIFRRCSGIVLSTYRCRYCHQWHTCGTLWRPQRERGRRNPRCPE